MTETTAQNVIRAAMSVARDVGEGRLDPNSLDAELVTELRRIFGMVVGEGDPAWPLQIDVCRQVLAAGGLSVDELREWLAVLERRRNGLDPA